MAFVQVIECRTDQGDKMNELWDEWLASTAGRRTMTRSTIGRDAADQDHYVQVVEFASKADADAQSSLPESDRIRTEMLAICDEPPTIVELELLRTDT